VPENGFFATVAEHKPGDFLFGRRYFNIGRTDDLAVIRLTVSNTRTLEQRKALHRLIAGRLAKKPATRPQDAFINLVEVAKVNWSFGNGVAQYA
jgi:4-oxalocrotonate tautomerase